VIRKAFQLFRTLGSLSTGPLVSQRDGQLVVPLADSAGIQYVRLAGNNAGSPAEPTMVTSAGDNELNTKNMWTVESYLMGFDSSVWERIRSSGVTIDAVTQYTSGQLTVQNFPYTFNENRFDRTRSAAQANITLGPLGTLKGCQYFTGPGQWSVFNQPAAATAATATQSALSGKSLILQNISATTTDTATLQVLQVLDGATVIWSQVLGGTGGPVSFVESGLNLVGTLGNTMTVKFTAAPAAGKNQAVAISGVAFS